MQEGWTEHLTSHGLSHTFASPFRCLESPSILAVKELLGHGSIEMILRYAHLSPDVKRDAVKFLDLKSGTPSGTLTALGPVPAAANEETPDNSMSYRGLDGAGQGI